MKQKASKYGILVLLIALFTAPGIAAYLFYSHPHWLGGTRTNKGILLNTPVELTSLAKKQKWRVLFWTPSLCERECLSNIDTLARVRLALGRKLYHVEQMLIVDKENASSMAAIKPQLKEKDFTIHYLSGQDKQTIEQLSNRPQIFIMDPDNYLVLTYSANTKPQDIYKDLKLLLNNYELKQG